MRAKKTFPAFLVVFTAIMSIYVYTTYMILRQNSNTQLVTAVLKAKSTSYKSSKSQPELSSQQQQSETSESASALEEEASKEIKEHVTYNEVEPNEIVDDDILEDEVDEELLKARYQQSPPPMAENTIPETSEEEPDVSEESENVAESEVVVAAPADTENVVEEIHIEQKYIAYLPHSGFCNQRIELENAIVVAMIMNRTLILPPLYLGHSAYLSWHPFQSMKSQLVSGELADNSAASGLGNVGGGRKNGNRDVALVPYSELFDFASVSDLVKVVHIEEFLKDHKQPGGKTETYRTFEIRDSERYDYKLVDYVSTENGFLVDFKSNNVQSIAQKRRSATTNTGRNILQFKPPSNQTLKTTIYMNEYNHLVDLSIPLDQWTDSSKSGSDSAAKSTILQFGSLFGTTRLKLLNDRNKWLMRKMRKRLFQIKNQILFSTSAKIIERLGGRGRFLAVHLRVGDANFADKTGETVARVADRIGREGSSMVVYIATDSKTSIFQDSTYDLLFRSARNKNVKIFTLQNFTAEVAEMKEALISDRRDALRSGRLGWHSRMSDLFQWQATGAVNTEQLHVQDIGGSDDYDNDGEGDRKYGNMWIPFIDQLVCSRAQKFIGTSGSTFSMFIKMLHENEWSSSSSSNLKQ